MEYNRVPLVFHNALAAAAATPDFIAVPFKAKRATFTYRGTATTIVGAVQGALDEANPFVLEAVNTADSTDVIAAFAETGKGKAYRVDVEGLNYLRFPVTTLTGGNITLELVFS